MRRDGLYRKFTREAPTEAATLAWLRAQGLPAAEVFDVGADWLITREIPGRTAAEWWPAHQRLRIVDALVEITRALHALPVGACPFDRTLAVTEPLARAAAQAGAIDLDDLDDEWRGWTASELLAALDVRLPDIRGREVPVVTHGDWCLPNVVLDMDTVEVVGLLDTGWAGRADRYNDLALMSRSLGSSQLNPQYGRYYADRFLNRYGHQSADDDKLAFYRLLDEFF
jgi:kanamycin kinase